MPADLARKDDLILVALSTFAEHDRAPLDRLEAAGYPMRIHRTGKRITTPELLEAGRDATVILASVEPYDAATIEALPRLRCIARVGAGTDNVDLKAARARGITVLNTPDVPAAAVAELALTMFLALSRNLTAQSRLMHERRWERVETHLLGGRTVGLIGLGRIGRRVAELARAFGARVVAFDPFADQAWAARTGVTIATLDDVIAGADILSLHAARSSSTPLRLGATELARMKPGSLVVNLARGGMIDEPALVDAITRGHIAGAGLDVFEQEPYSGAFCDLEQVILTPHSATLAVETRVAMEVEAVDKALRFLEGTLVDHERVE
jgi:D-3-phosphoglycerate dehydrogenase